MLERIRLSVEFEGAITLFQRIFRLTPLHDYESFNETKKTLNGIRLTEIRLFKQIPWYGIWVSGISFNDVMMG